MKPDNFEDISAVGALYRPGPMGANSHTNYALRKNGRQEITPIHPELEEPLESIEQPEISCRFHCICPDKDMRKCTDRHTIPSSNAWVPAAAGLIAGGEAVKDLVNLAHTMRIRPEDEATSEPARIAHERAAKMLEEHRRLKAEKTATVK